MRGKLIIPICLFLLGLTTPGAADLVGYWPLDEGSGSQVVDRTGNGHTGTIEGATWTTPGWDGKGACLEFDGANDLVRIADAPDLQFGSDAAYALTAWVNVTVLPGSWSGVVTKGRDTDDWYGIWINGGNNWVFGHGPNNQIGSGVVAGVWTHVAMVYDDSSKKIYLNGQLDNETTASATGDTAADLVFGAALGVTEFAPIRLNEVRIYDHALDEAGVIASMESLSPPELAADPLPKDEATDVSRDGDLSWTPGVSAATHDVYFGASFDDVNDASRDNPLDTLLVQGQAASTYDPGRLEFGRTYYWRIDEVNAAPDNTIFKGTVWSFTAEPFAYTVENIMATSNVASDPTGGPENTVNGSGLNDADEHSFNAPDMWLVAPGGAPVHIQYEFDRVYKLYEMQVWNYNVMFELLLGFGVKDATVEYSVNGTDWMALGDVVLAQGTGRSDYRANTVVDFQGTAAKFVRLNVNSGYGVVGQFGLSEVRFLQIPGHARYPQPPDAQTTVDVST
ncbi:MAG: LamG domain-containing protein, partial [Planctomycetota bacterium]